MVDKETMAKEATDMRDPAFQDLYVPRKEGDPTGSSQVNNELAKGLTGEQEGLAFEQALNQRVQRPILLAEPTRFPTEPNTAGITQGPGPGPEKTRPTTDLKSFVSGVLGKYRHPILAELNVELNTPVVEQPNTRFRMTDSQFKDYA